jgi:hypothetical protein
MGYLLSCIHGSRRYSLHNSLIVHSDIPFIVLYLITGRQQRGKQNGSGKEGGRKEGGKVKKRERETKRREEGKNVTHAECLIAIIK